MLAIPSTGASGRAARCLDDMMLAGGWVLDTKLDGIRAMWTGSALVNRKGVDITRIFPEVATFCAKRMPAVMVDGEIVAADGRFETTLLRESQTLGISIERFAHEKPCKFVAFDLPEMGMGVDAKPWSERRQVLEKASEMLDWHITPVSYDDSLFEKTRELGMEGVIAKRINSPYRPSKRSTDWVKFKHLHRVTCLIAGAVPGNGYRAHLGALVLALFDGDQVVGVGRCGSGFTEKESHDLRARIDAGEILLAEIETVNVTSGRTLRFPVYRGLRADLTPEECTIAQLSTIPNC